MAIDKKFWQIDSFSWKSPMPAWTCPVCDKGLLKSDLKKLNPVQTRETEKAKRSKLWENPKTAEFRFTGFLICDNPHCGEKVVISGRGLLYADANDQPALNTYQLSRYSVFLPKYFEPPLRIIHISSSVPKTTANEIIKSFQLYWADTDACANKIRSCLELIMDHQKVTKFYIDKKRKRRQYPLHARIELFGKRDSELVDYIHAIKWIGNAGSHVGDLSKSALLDGYELLEHCLDELYEKKARLKKLKSKASKINKRRKPTT